MFAFFWPSFLLLNTDPREIKAYVPQKTCTQMITESLRGQPKLEMLWVHRQANGWTSPYPPQCVSLSNKEEGTSDTWGITARLSGVEKPETKESKVRDSIYRKSHYRSNQSLVTEQGRGRVAGRSEGSGATGPEWCSGQAHTCIRIHQAVRTLSANCTSIKLSFKNAVLGE